jgi:uncharacterized membrane protein
MQRWSALLGGGALAVIGLGRRSPAGFALAAAGGALAYLGARTNGQSRSSTVAHTSIVVNCTPEVAYQRWHNFEEFPRFMPQLDSVKKTGDRTYRWEAVSPVGGRVQWDAEIVDEQPNQSISWRSLPNSEVMVDGQVQFRPANANRGTLITATIDHRSSVAPIARGLSKLIGADPSFFLRQNLRRFKALIETGEIPTTEGQSHGPRSSIGEAMHRVNPSKPVQSETAVAGHENWRTA